MFRAEVFEGVGGVVFLFFVSGYLFVCYESLIGCDVGGF